MPKRTATPTKRPSQPVSLPLYDEPFEPKSFYTFKQVGQPLGKAERTVREWADRGLIKTIKLPAGQRIRGSEINRFLSERES